MTIQDLASSQLAGQPAPWHPFRDDGVQPFPLNGTSKIDNEARELYAIVEQRQEHVTAVNRAERDAQLAVRRAEETYQADVARSAAAGVVSTLDGELLAACESAAAAANPQLHRGRRKQATALAQEAEAAYVEFIDTHAIEFVRETQERAHRIAGDYLKAREEATKILQVIEQEHWALVEATRFIVGGTHPLTRDDIEHELGKPPTLIPAALERLDPTPSPVAVEPEPAEVTSV